jgi:hypothetical protein
MENASAMGSFYEQNLAADHGREMCICCGQLGVERAPEKGIGVVLWFQRKWGNGRASVPLTLTFSSLNNGQQDRKGKCSLPAP